jgi:glycosyltransferase involved in cell wall biosynthesis
MKLLVISDAHLITQNGKKVAYAPYVKEMDLWMAYVSETTFVSPNKIAKPLLARAFKKQDFVQMSVRRLEFHTLKHAVLSLLTVPYQALLLWKAMRRADHIHMRAPGNLVLLAGIVSVMLPRKRKTIKYAGNFSPIASQPVSYRLQKKIFSNTRFSKNTTVMAYGDWPRQTANVEPFFTATYSERQKGHFLKYYDEPLQFMFVGTLSQNKNPQLLVYLIKALNEAGISSQGHFYGDGAMKEALRVQSSALNVRSSDFGNRSLKPQNQELEVESIIAKSAKSSFLSDKLGWEKEQAIFFHGNQPAAIVTEAYKRSHFLFLASQSEGWPKVVAEAMWHGCIPIATPVSCVPWMLGIENPKSQIPNSNAINDMYNVAIVASNHINPNEIVVLEKESGTGKTNIVNFNFLQIGTRGICFTDIAKIVTVVQHLLAHKETMKLLSRNAQSWSQEYTLERFEAEIVKLLKS